MGGKQIERKISQSTYMYIVLAACAMHCCVRCCDGSLSVGDFELSIGLISFSHNSTRSGFHLKVVHQLAKANRFNQFYFTRLPRLWNALPPMDLSKSYITIVNNIGWEYFVCNFDQSNICTFHFCCPCSRCHNVTTCTLRINSDQS